MKKYLLLCSAFIVVTASFLAYPVLAQSVLPSADPVDFDGYENGNLNGQGGWSDAWNSLLVQDAVTFGGDKAIQNRAGVGAIGYKELSDEFSEKGVVSVKIRIDGNSFSDNQNVFGLYKGMNEEYVALFRFGNHFDGLKNMLLLSIAESADVAEVEQITQGEWHKISIAWRNGDFKIRIKVDNNDWTEWFPSQTTWNKDEPLGIRVSLPEADRYGNFYIDDIKSFVAYEEPVYDPVLLVEETTSDTTTDIPNTNTPSITSPVPESDETAPSATSSESQNEQPSISADTDNDQIITAPF